MVGNNSEQGQIETWRRDYSTIKDKENRLVE
jgi:hypothetical protein